MLVSWGEDVIAKGPFFNSKQNYALTFTDAQGSFVQVAHLKQLNTYQAAAQGLDAAQMNLEALCSDPKSGSDRIRHDMTATIEPDFMGLQGTFAVRARPESRLKAVVSAIGLKVYGEFSESASSASNDLTDAFTRRRFVPTGGKTETGGPAGTYQSETVMLKYLANRERGDELDDFSPVFAEVVALAGTLQPGDLLISPIHGTYQVRGVAEDGSFERGRLER